MTPILQRPGDGLATRDYVFSSLTRLPLFHNFSLTSLRPTFHSLVLHFFPNPFSSPIVCPDQYHAPYNPQTDVSTSSLMISRK